MKKTIIFIVSICIGLSGLLLNAEDQPRRATGGHIPNSDCVYIQSHRGAGYAGPENTLWSFQYAWDRGCIPELDARLTRDNVIVCLHNDTLASQGRKIPDSIKHVSVRKLDWSQIRDADVGLARGKQFEGQKIPTLEQVFEVMQKNPSYMVYIDEKGAPPQQIADMAKRLGVLKQIIFSSSNPQRLIEWKKIAPETLCSLWMNGSEQKIQAILDDLVKNNFEAIDILEIGVHTDYSKWDTDPFTPSSDFLRRSGELLKSHGIVFRSATNVGDKPEVYRRLIGLGVRCFSTDYLDACLEGCRNDK